ncbi:NAD(P)/FAD-dependent oxidoreductase [Ramlibacter monticola]|uniref:NAD(P)/FAD-dependent oxidoreductase n=1 Tax=Ramlibacter monticola TaxID=1926872 RepID=A0A936YXM1_9BURK|nr:NAD(P)/FAD-dependent oxidoreductase [Ramlibacter monticola]MBL0390507.1 NAD(P)/FAD-dependent oxidoreductase [Ramlibacter monticola]
MSDAPAPSAFDAVVIGAGAAGLYCAAVAGQLGVKVLLVDHADKLAEKIRISGGGRCNFTNRDLDPRAPHKHFLGDNPNFCRSALARFTPADFIALVQKHGIPFHEKHKGQLFGDRASEDFIRMLQDECGAGDVAHWQPCSVRELAADGAGYVLQTSRGTVRARRVVIATGGLSIPKIGASDFGYRIAQQFGLRVVPPRPALVPLTFDGEAWAPFAQLAGLSLPVRIETGEKKDRMAFDEDLLFTHRGLSGPAVLQISSYWREGQPLRIDLAPGVDVAGELARAKTRSRKLLANELAQWVPARLAEAWVQQDPAWQRPVNEAGDKALQQLAQRLSRWELVPTGTEGYRKAEVTAGGVDTRELSSQTLESRQAGLYFIGEVVDVTGWLGGYNFQWAWASARACAQALAATNG